MGVSGICQYARALYTLVFRSLFTRWQSTRSSLFPLAVYCCTHVYEFVYRHFKALFCAFNYGLMLILCLKRRNRLSCAISRYSSCGVTTVSSQCGVYSTDASMMTTADLSMTTQYNYYYRYVIRVGESMLGDVRVMCYCGD